MKKETWFVASWEDPDFLSGQSVANILSELQQILQCRSIIVSGFEGKGEGVIDLPREDDSSRLFLPDQLLQVLAEIRQIEWCDFFFVDEETERIVLSLSVSPYQVVLPKTSCTLRAVDGHLFMVYTRDKSLVNALAVKRPGVELEEGLLQNLSFPS